MPTVRDDGWILAPAANADFDEVMTWFPDADSVNLWGGPDFRYPFTGETFREDCRIDIARSWCLRDGEGRRAAFGQAYERDGRGHLMRLISNPSLRRQGAGKQLIRMIIAALEETGTYDEYSLFVYRHNTPAYQCYLSLGFNVADYPHNARMPDKCFFLTKKAIRRE
jgi:ribosomal protein S18 acetylase RimI-like enzyme